MTYLPPDPPLAGPEPKISAAAALHGPRLPVTRWNRRYLFAGGAALAAVVGFGFYLGFGGTSPAHKKAASDAPAADVTPTTPAIAERYPNGYGDPAVSSAAPGVASLPPPAPVSAAAPAAQAQPVDPAVQQAQAQALAARSSSPFFQASGGPQGSPPPPIPAAFVAPGGEPSASAATPAAADVVPANGQGAKRAFAQASRADDYLANSLREPVSPWEVKAAR